MVVVFVVECCLLHPGRLVLKLVLTFAPSVLTFAACTLTFVPCAYGVILVSTSAGTPHSHMVMVTGCNLHWWRFSFLPLAHILHLCSSNLHCVVVVYIYVHVCVCVRVLTLCKQVLQLYKLDAATCAGVKWQLETILSHCHFTYCLGVALSIMLVIIDHYFVHHQSDIQRL